MKTNKIFESKSCIAALFLIFSFAVSLLMKFLQTGDAFHPSVIVPVIAIFLTTLSIALSALYLIKKIEKFDLLKTKKLIFPSLLAFYVIAFIAANVAVILSVFVWFVLNGSDLSMFWQQMMENELMFANEKFAVGLLIFTIILFFILWQKSVNKEYRLREENLKFRYQNLKSHLNPHFLFNTLNDLSEIVHTDADGAERYIIRLSEIYRYVLANEETDYVPLSSEIDFVKSYFWLQSERGGDKCNLKIDLNGIDRWRVIPVSVQMLVENAIKHNSISSTNPLNITLTIEDDYLVVSNNIQRRSLPGETHRTGLKNLRERTKLLTKKDIVVIENSATFIVKIPLLAN